MAEIIAEPTVLSKVIALKFKINDVDVPKTTQLPTNKQFNTTDTDAWFTFELDGLASTNGTYDLTLINLDDKSIFHHADVLFQALPFHYKLNSSEDVTLNEIRHAGRWLGQLVVSLSNGDTTARQFGFNIAGHILDGQDVQVILLSDYQTLINTINLAKDDLAQYNVDYAALIADVDAKEALLEQAEIDRAATFDALVDSEMVAQNVATKLTEKEATFAPRMLSLESELADKATKDELSQELLSLGSQLADKATKDELSQELLSLGSQLAQTENEIPVTAYMTKEELEDIKLSSPLLDHSNSIQNYVNDMRAKNLFGLYFPSGNYRFKNIDLGEGNWSVSGPFVASGYIQKVTFNIISELNAKAFIGSNRYMSIANIRTVNSGSKDDGLNVGFYKNTIKNGAFLNATNMMLSKFSGDCFDILDAIDTKFEDIRATDNNNVFKIKKAEWVASTTVTLKKIYAERNNSVIDAPFCRQSKMDDVIFEYNEKIGNITDGSWTLDNLYLENNAAPLDATNSLLTKLYIYSMTANDGILNTQPTVNPVDKGDSQLNWKGLNASKVEYDTMHPRTIFTGNYTGDSWVKLGRWESFNKGGRLQIKLLGGNGWGQTLIGFDAPVGETTINLLHAINTSPELPNTLGFAYHTGGGKPLLEVKVKAVEPEWRDKFDIYVKVTAYARFVSADYKVVQGIFIKDLVLDVGYPGDNDKNVHGVKMEHNIQTETGSFGIKDNGQLDMKAPITGGGTMPTNVKNYLPIIVNGVSYNIPLL